MTATHDFRPSYAAMLEDGGYAERLAALTPHEEALMRENHELRRQLDALYEHVDSIETDAACGVISGRPREYLVVVRDRCSLLLRGPRLA